MWEQGTASTLAFLQTGGVLPPLRFLGLLTAGFDREGAMESARTLREKAGRYRQLAFTLDDRQAVEAARELASQYEALAAELEAAERDPDAARGIKPDEEHQ